MATNDEILEELQKLNQKMDQLIHIMQKPKGRVPQDLPVPERPQPMAHLQSGPLNMPMAPAMPNFSGAPNAEHIKKTVEEKIRQARADAQAKIDKMGLDSQEG